MKYIFDNDISYRYAAMLRGLGVDAHGVREVEGLSHDTKDPEILRYLSAREIVFLSADRGIVSKTWELRALRDAGVTALFLAPFFHRQDFWKKAEWFIRHWRTIDGFARGATRGTLAEIKQGGRSQLIRI